MSLQDPISDFLTRIRNGQMVHKKLVSMPGSKTKVALAKVLNDEGYISGYQINQENPKKPVLDIQLKYFEGRPVIEEISRVSRPSLRVYKSSEKLPVIKGGLGVAIISTCQGVMTDKEARKLGIGGEVVCTVS